MDEAKKAVDSDTELSEDEDLIFQGSFESFLESMVEDEEDEDVNLSFDDFNLEDVDIELVEIDGDEATNEKMNQGGDVVDLSDDLLDDINIELEFTRNTFRGRQPQEAATESTEGSLDEENAEESMEDFIRETPSQTKTRKRPRCSACGKERVVCNQNPCSVVQQRKAQHVANKVSEALFCNLLTYFI